jgi:hypothetical protein
MHCNHWTCDDLFPFFKFDFWKRCQ